MSLLQEHANQLGNHITSNQELEDVAASQKAQSLADKYNEIQEHYNAGVGAISTLSSAFHMGRKVYKGLQKARAGKKIAKKSHSNEIINKINEVLDSKIRPAVAKDGGDITFKSFKDGIVTVELKGSCSGCPSSIMTLKQGVQNLLCHYIPEVKSVEAR